MYASLTKRLPPEFSGNPTVTVVYGSKVAQMLLGEEISVFVIKSKELAENYKKILQIFVGQCLPRIIFYIIYLIMTSFKFMEIWFQQTITFI